MTERYTRDSIYSVDLDRSRAPGVFRGVENLWRNDLGRIYRLIERQVGAIEAVEHQHRGRSSYEPDNDQEGPAHLSIAIFGPSGSGKSSLLRTLVDDVNRRRPAGAERPVIDGTLSDRVRAIEVLDPTTWSSNDQFLYAFLARALEEEQQLQRRFDEGSPRGLSAVQLAFQEVNEYLRVVDDPSMPDEHDPLGLSLQRLERHTSGIRLRGALGRFIDRLAEAFSAKAVLLPVDDLDMAPDHLVTALQTYQSFLAHPKLIPIFTFTDRTPEEILEAYFGKRLENPSQRNLFGDDYQRLTVNEQLAVQFLARCFPVRNRIRLGPAPARVQRARFTFRRTPSSGDGDRTAAEGKVLDLLSVASFVLFGHPDKEDAHQVRASLRPSTLRRQFQVVDAMADSQLYLLKTPQLALMSDPNIDAKGLAALVSSKVTNEDIDDWALWKDRKGPWSEEPGEGIQRRKRFMRERWRERSRHSIATDDQQDRECQFRLARSLKDHGDGTWATVFNNATWSLLNVHRDTLRELGLFLEDLYSWSPKELRSVVLDRILAQDRITRRTVVDRWFNRTDYRRSQVLSLLAANVFRPWMEGEEPFGDEELALRKQLEIEERDTSSERVPTEVDEVGAAEFVFAQTSFPANKGLLWFLNVALGFYLPQILARNWSEALSEDEPLKGRMSGNGWDLQHAPINAIRIADARREVFSFGMLFLDPEAYSTSLSAMDAPEHTSAGNAHEHLLLRMWSCYGFSRGRLWAAYSFWRGLGLIGQVLEVGLRYEDPLEAASMNGDEAKELKKDLTRLLRSHCLAGMVPGTLLDRGSDDKSLDLAFEKWDPPNETLNGGIKTLVDALVQWLQHCWADRIVPFPTGKAWIGWRDCFIRRIHGEYVLGGLWPRLNAAYLERHHRVSDPESKNHWSAALASRVWGDHLLEYWRGCPEILRLLLTCPLFLKNRERFGERGTAPNLDKGTAWLKDRLAIPEDLHTSLTKGTEGTEGTAFAVDFDLLQIPRVEVESFNVQRCQDLHLGIDPVDVRLLKEDEQLPPQ